MSKFYDFYMRSCGAKIVSYIPIVKDWAITPSKSNVTRIYLPGRQGGKTAATETTIKQLQMDHPGAIIHQLQKKQP